MRCHFCNFEGIENVNEHDILRKPLSYDCPRCGPIDLTEEAIDLIASRNFTEEQLITISIVVRNEYQRTGRRQQLTTDYLDQILEQYRQLDALDQMGKALQKLERKSKHIGNWMKVDLENDFPYYYCFDRDELHALLVFLHIDGLIIGKDETMQSGLCISTKGYQRLRELRKNKDSRQCFVAMWLDPKMNHVFKTAIEPAIEYSEEGQTEPRFRALKIDNKEHTNDINDEIIAQIRRSRFMVCDLTGYRGGVYWEAGFAYGLGLEVIYTCRKDWIKGEILNDDKGKKIETLLDSDKKKIYIKKEGIHFDLEHRNRIEWEEGDLEGFQDRLTKRIKAVII